jgi:hypothetical protein
MLDQLSPVGPERLGIIVCTRDRATSLINLLNSITSCRAVPKVVAIVDSNSADVTAHATSQRGTAGPIAIQYLRSELGFLYQRNLGIAAIIEIGVPRQEPDDLIGKAASTRQAGLVIASR